MIRIAWASVFSCGLNCSTSKTCTEMSVNKQFIKENQFIYLTFYEAACLYRILLDPLRDCLGWVTSSFALFWGVWRKHVRVKNHINRQEAKDLFRSQTFIIIHYLIACSKVGAPFIIYEQVNSHENWGSHHNRIHECATDHAINKLKTFS